MQKSIRAYVISILIGILILTTTYFWAEKNYLLMGIIMIVLVIVPFIVRFETRKVQAEEIVMIAVIVAIAAVGRVPFAALPSIQPTSFVIILAAIVFGSEAGFLVGGLAALVSNMFLGQGPWTPWQMFAWALMGLSAGLLRNTFIIKNKYCRLCFGFVWGFLFGWIMNFWFVLNLGEQITWQTIVTGAIMGFSMDLNHAICNVVFLALFSNTWIKTLTRTKQKYGLL